MYMKMDMFFLEFNSTKGASYPKAYFLYLSWIM